MTLPNATRPTLRLLGCSETRVGLELPKSMVEAVIPPAFEVTGGLTLETAGALVVVNECERGADDQSVMESIRLYSVQVSAVPKNASWHTENWLSYYVMDVASDNPALVQALNNHSMAAANASFSRIALPLVQDFSTTHWKVEAGAWSATFDYSKIPFSPQNLTLGIYLWSGNGPYARVTFLQAHLADSLSWPGALVLTGDSRLGQAVPGEIWPYGAASSSDAEMFYQFDGEWNG